MRIGRQGCILGSREEGLEFLLVAPVGYQFPHFNSEPRRVFLHDKNVSNGILEAASKLFSLWKNLGLDFIPVVSNAEQVPCY